MYNFWEATEEDPYKLDSVTEEMIKHIENKLNIILPESYKKLILKQNGGMINYNAFPTTVQNSWAEDHIEFDYLLGLGEDPGILDSSYLIKEWDLPENILLIHGDGHTWVAMDYRETNSNPPIHYFDVETDQDFKLATSFDEFLSKLYSHHYDMDTEIYNNEETEIHNASESITSEEVVKILKEKNPLDIYRVAYYPIKDTNALAWVINQIKESSYNLNDEQAFELADLLMTLATTYDNHIKTTILKDRIEEIVANLSKQKNEDVDNILTQIKDFL
ncbi:SMI1/KNR4 family protein [Bacillus amyloliquefaciens]|uniref:SMI1/KNR4 family protein n=1 Tax=Bacillus amyloliquefaciens group TaxID=1938374 RepID=UPI00157CC0DB|nr:MULTISPECIES: SMI1/KNR4 family protein [Bacillus amyloliquefaciens group]MCC8308225.1 SMI1/KNR4 family protein [Bacillus velezensis]MCD5429072.1 SMI1/KNR4 family protein [Bacillus amyloliquefaciens]MCO7130688.1 SMI1/KNR4 family protein [Bacillus velezensis]MCO7138569.1 SMI1/KNR4 family protein [Bacillus velezensis]QKP73663.1 SMI1/KNR4 family protein [Bacillus amyloliquefaciens]